MRFAIIGPGAIGSLFGGLLAAGGADVALLSRPGPRHDRIAADGLRLSGLRGDILVSVPIESDPAKLGKFDVLLVTVKSYDTLEAIRMHHAALADDGVVVSLQNGIGNVEVIAEEVGADRTLAASTVMGVYIDSNGVAQLAGEGDTVIGEMDGGSTQRVRTIAETMSATGLPVKAVPDIRALLFTKLAVNCAINPLTALLSVDNGVVGERPSLVELAKRAVSEVALVAKAEGIELSERALHERTFEVCRITHGNQSSMRKDVEAGRKTEIAAINAAVADLGRKHSIPTPVNEMLSRLILAKAHEG